MGNLLSQVNSMKDKLNRIKNNVTDEVDSGYPGSGRVSLQNGAPCPPGHKTINIQIKVGKIPEINKIMLYECLDELKNDGSYRFSGIETIWRDKKDGNGYRGEGISGAKTQFRVREIGALDFIKQICLGTKTHDGVEYVSYCGIDLHVGDPTGAGDMQAPFKYVKSSNTTHVEGVQWFRLTVHKKLKVITNVECAWARVADKKVKVDDRREEFATFLKTPTEVQAYAGSKIYDYKSPENKFEDFATFVTNGKIAQEYLGGLPVRFLSPEEQGRYKKVVELLQLEPLLQVLRTKGNINHVKLDPAIEDKVVAFVVRVLYDELFTEGPNTPLNTLVKNIRFIMKMLCIVFTDDEGIWKKVTGQLKAKYEERAGTLFDKAMDEIRSDPKIAELQKVEPMEDQNVKGKYQKACPQCPDKDGQEQDVEKLAKGYMLDAAQYLQEFHTTFRSKFGDKYHGAPVKGLDRIKAKCQEYRDEEKLNASDSVARIMDFLRGTVECHNGKEVLDALNEIKKFKGDYKIVRIKNGFKDMTKKGYKSFLLNIMIYDSLICELQITFECMKNGNDVNHFLYEVLREHSLYAMVAKNLNLNTAFKEWLEPFAPKMMKVNFPTNVVMNWKGFWVEPDSKGFFDLYDIGNTTRCYFLMNFKIDMLGKITGGCGDRNGNYKIEGKLDVDARTIEFTKTPLANAQPGGMYGGPPTGPTYNVTYKGKFLDKSMAEGDYQINMLNKGQGDAMGSNWLNKLVGGDSAQKGVFRLWADDFECPGLHPGLIAFRDVNKDSKVVRKKYIPSDKMKWTGVLAGAEKGNKDAPLNLQMKFANPLKIFGGQAITGKGKMGAAPIVNIDGAHSNYDTLIMELWVRPGGLACLGGGGSGKSRNITVNAFFIEDLKLRGVYDDNGHLGRFELECPDDKAKEFRIVESDSSTNRYELLVTYHDGTKQFSQASIKVEKDGSFTGKGSNQEGNFELKGKGSTKVIVFNKVQKNPDGTEEKLEFDGQFLTEGQFEGFFRSPTSYGRFKFNRC